MSSRLLAKAAGIVVLGLLVSASPALAQLSISLDILSPPPPPRVEVIPQAPEGQFWIAGHWSFDGHRHVWQPGRYEPLRPGYRYVPARWDRRGERHHFEPGHWVPERQAHAGPREHPRQEPAPLPPGQPRGPY